MMSNARLFSRYERELDRMIAATMPRTPKGVDAQPAVRVAVPVPALTATIESRMAAAGAR